MIEIRQIECREGLRGMAAGSVQMIATSPPYWGLRSYPGVEAVWDDGWRGQLGLEPTVELYVEHMTGIFRECRRVLRDDGCVFLNIGDGYAGSGKAGQYGIQKWGGIESEDQGRMYGPPVGVPVGLKPKDLIGVPWRLAFALQGFAVVPGSALNHAADILAEAREKGDWEAVLMVEGMLRAWASMTMWLEPCWNRSAIIWAKGISCCPTYAGSVMPESCTDRPTSAYEMVFLLTKSAHYFWDAEAVKEASSLGTNLKGSKLHPPIEDAGVGHKDWHKYTPEAPSTRNIRNVWVIGPEAYRQAHYATWPSKLCDVMVKAGSSPRACGVCGAPWVRVVEKSGGTTGKSWHDHQADLAEGAGQGAIARSRGYGSDYQVCTTGWRPTCEHEDDTGQCVVLDPFCGASGRLGLVCKKLGRSFIGLEMSPDYVEQCRANMAAAVTAELFQ